MKRVLLYIICCTLLQATLFAQLGTAAHFTLFTSSGAVGNTGASNITGNIGTNNGAVTGFDPSVSGNTHIANSITAQCATDLQAAYNQFFSTPATSTNHAPAFGSGETLTPGVYLINGAGSVAGNLTLDAQGNRNAVFLFKINGAFNTAAATNVTLTNKATACNIFWIAEGAIAMGASTTMRGTLISNNGAISMAAGGLLEGRMFSTTGAVAVDAVQAFLPDCSDTLKGTWHTTSGANIKSANNIFIVMHNMDLVNDGNFVQGVGDGTTIITGSTNTSTSGTGVTTLDQLEVAVDTGFSHTLTSTVNIKNAITLTSGQLISDGFLTLKSDSINTARVAPVMSSASPAIAGNVVVERYIPGRRKYRLLTSSVTTSPSATLSVGQEDLSIWGNWQNGGSNSTANTGTIITGGTAADGFDPQIQNVSMFTYDDVGRKFIGFSSALGKNTKYTPLKAGATYYIFVYGDRTNTVTTSSPKSTVLKQTGTLLLGDQTYNTGSTIPIANVVGRFTLLGNPFASPVDWASFTKTNIANTYWGWDPNLSSTGGYITVTTVGNSIVISPLTGTTALNQFIQPGQGFFVKTTATSPALTISEQHKTGNIIGNAFRMAGDNSLPLLAVNLQYTNGVNNVVADGTLAIFDSSFSNQTGSEDATKMLGNTESVSIQNGNEFLSIYGRQMPANNDTIYLNVLKLTRPQYTLQIFAKYLPNTVAPYLEDNYLHTSQQLATTDTNLVTVNINLSDTASYDAKRFRIVFRPSSPLPVKFISIQAVKNDKQVSLEWKVADEDGLRNYEIERSVNGSHFIKKGETAVHSNLLNTAYQWTDIQPAVYNYYRVRAIQADGKFFYSKVVTVRMDLLQPSIHIFPNPIQNETVQIAMKGVETGKYAIEILNMKGQVVYNTSMQHERNIENHAIVLNAKIPSGSYVIIIKSDKLSLREMLIIK